MKYKSANKCQRCSLNTKKGWFCKQLTDIEVAKLSNLSRTITLKRSQSIGREELLMWPIIAISSGVISLQHLLEDGRKTISALLMPGDILDMRGISARSSGHLIALSKTEACRLSPAVFEKIIETNPNAQRIAWNNLRDQTYRAINHSADLAKKQAVEKLASFVFECRNRQPSNVQDGLIHLPVRRIDMADYLGMQQETISRCFRDMELRGIIELQSISKIKILDIPTLRRIANGDRNTENLRHTSENNFKVLCNE